MTKTVHYFYISIILTTSYSLAFAKTKIKFISDDNLITGSKNNNILIGGLSGCSYNSKKNLLFAVSDDRGEFGGPRVHSFQIGKKGNKYKIIPKSTTILKNQSKKPFALKTLDLEGISLTKKGNFLIISEGIYKPKKIFSKIYEFSQEGLLYKEYSLPPHFLKGYINNKSFESLSLSLDDEFLLTTTELPLKQDSLNPYDPYIHRVLKLVNWNTSYPKTIEYVYLMRKLDRKGDTGLVDLLSLSKNSFLSLERSFLEDSKENIIKIFEVEISNYSTEVSKYHSLSKRAWTPLVKNLLLNLNQIIPKLDKKFPKLDNFEGMCFGPILKNGNKTLILVSDNNFNKFQRTSFLFFEIIQ